jgi:hypothetical protein
MTATLSPASRQMVALQQMETLMDPKDLCEQLEKGFCIAIVWYTDDVKSVRPDLDDTQCLEVLHACDRYHDATMGINWDIIEFHADMLFPQS